MQPNKTKLSLAIGVACLVASSIVMADTFTATVTTLDDVTITPIDNLDFGTVMFTATNQTCSLDADVPGNIRMRYATTGVVAAAAYGDLTGSGCVNGTGLGTPGLYEISGGTGLAVNLLISSIGTQPDGDYTFTPVGCYTDFDGTTTDDADDCTVYTAGTPIIGALLADTTGNEDNTTTPSGASDAGRLRFTVGGDINTGTGLVPETAYGLEFQVDVTY